MPFHLNQVNIAGTMTRDAEVSYTPKGTAVANLSLAINRVWTNDAGEKMEETTFIEVQAWGRTAEIIGEHTGKGHTIMIEGRLKMDTWEDKETGKKRQKIYVVCERFHFVSKPRSESEGGESQERGQGRQSGGYQKRSAPPAAKRPAPPRDPDLDAPADDDDVPF
jgi:single-strand DNA-binding protein